jgi:superfamily II RNA helicase
MPGPLHDLLPGGDADADELLGRFLEYVASLGLDLYPAQEEAVLEVFEGRNVILNTPTGSGKSLVASALHFASLAGGRRSVYTCPIKALVNEKWMALCRELGPETVGLATGDATVNRDAPVLCCTAEILANIALRQGEDAWVDDVVMDEFHWYADRDRGVAWQVPLLTLPRTRFLLMSATLGDVSFFAEELTRGNGLETAVVKAVERPVPLEYAYSEIPLAQTLEKLVSEDKAPVYVVHFTQRDAADSAQDFTSLNLATREEKNRVAEAIQGFRFTSPYGPDVRKWLKQGIGVHHAGLLPKYRVLVEQLAQAGLLKVICGTDTLGVGINVPIRTVLFSRLCKFDGQKTAVLSARDFHQIAGRAGRKGFDDRGFVVVQAPEHVIENLRLGEKAKDGKKVVKRKPPERNFASWDLATFKRLIGAPPERLASRFHVSHGMLLNVLSRPGDGCRAMQRLIRESHEPDRAKKAHFKRAWQLFRALVERGIVEFVPVVPRDSGQSGPEESAGMAGLSAPGPTDAPRADAAKLRVNVELQDDFSMDQALSLYLLETIPLLDPDSETHALDLLTLVESILEDPELVLRRQLDKLKDRRVAEMKAEGMEYDQRMEELEKMEHPKPLRDFVYGTFNAFALRHPWVGEENIRPKSIAREMFEGFRSFSDYVQEYDLERAEGLLLRHLNSVYKVLVQTVPDGEKTDAVREMELYLRDMLRQIDSSLLEEWERMRDAARAPGAAGEELRPPQPEEPPDVTQDAKAFTASIRTRAFSFLRAWSIGKDEEALAAVDAPADASGQPWTPDRLKAAREAHRAEHGGLRLDPEARNLRHTHVLPADDRARWRVQQMLVDTEGHNDWVLELDVDLAASRETGEPVLKLLRLGSLT